MGIKRTVTVSAQLVMLRMLPNGLRRDECLPWEKRMIRSLVNRKLVKLDREINWLLATLTDDGRASVQY